MGYFSRYWNYTTCIEFNSLNILEKKITELLEQEDGCHRIYELPKLNFDLKQSSNYTQEKIPNLWIVCLFKGTDGWSVIKTFPTGFICARASDSEQSRLSNLTKQIKCNAFHLEIYRSFDGFLFESDAIGNTFLSGNPPLGDLEHFSFHDEQQVDLLAPTPNFYLIDVPELFKEAIKVNESPETQKQQAKIDALKPESPERFELLMNDPGYTQRIDLAFADLFDPNRNYWFLDNNLAYKAYNELDLLRSTNAKLLYFYPPFSYQPFVFPKRDILEFSKNTSKQKDDIPF